MPDTTLTPSSPWHRRSRLWAHEAEIRRLRAEGYSLQQIADCLGLGVTRQALHEFLRRADAAHDRAALAALDVRAIAARPSAAADDDFVPPTRSSRTS
jgi:hypothetical protein